MHKFRFLLQGTINCMSSPISHFKQRGEISMKLIYHKKPRGLVRRDDTETSILPKKCHVRSKIWWFTGSAIRITYRISLRSSSSQEPRYPLLKVVFYFNFTQGYIKRYISFIQQTLAFVQRFWLLEFRLRKEEFRWIPPTPLMPTQRAFRFTEVNLHKFSWPT